MISTGMIKEIQPRGFSSKTLVLQTVTGDLHLVINDKTIRNATFAVGDQVMVEHRSAESLPGCEAPLALQIFSPSPSSVPATITPKPRGPGRPRLNKPEVCTYCGCGGEEIRHRVCPSCHKIVSVIQVWRKRSRQELEEEIARQERLLEVKKDILAGRHPLTGKPLAKEG